MTRTTSVDELAEPAGAVFLGGACSAIYAADDLILPAGSDGDERLDPSCENDDASTAWRWPLPLVQNGVIVPKPEEDRRG